MTGPVAALDLGLARWQQDPSAAARAQVLAALPSAPVFAAITATATAEHVQAGTGLRAESSAQMALLLLEVGDERALPVFATADAVVAWRADARPVMLPAGQVFAAAVQERVAALVLDPGRADLVVGVAELAALTAGRVPVPGAALSARRTTGQLTAPTTPPPSALVAVLGAALRGEALTGARLLDGPSGPVLGVVPAGPGDPAALAALASRVRVRLGADLPAGGLDLAVVPADGPGHPVPLGRASRVRRPGR